MEAEAGTAASSIIGAARPDAATLWLFCASTPVDHARGEPGVMARVEQLAERGAIEAASTPRESRKSYKTSRSRASLNTRQPNVR
jgi:hypothetical protein